MEENDNDWFQIESNEDRLGLPDADVILLLCNSTKSKSSEDGTKWTGTCWPMPEETMRTSDSSDFG